MITLARSYFGEGQPPDYRCRNCVSRLSSGWNQGGATALFAPGKL